MLVLVLIGLICLLWAWSNKNRKNDEPPVCSGSKMFLGHALQYAGDSTKLWRLIQELNRECLDRGGVLKTTIGPKALYVVSSPEDCLTVSNTCLQKDAIYSFAKPWHGDGLVISDEIKWKVQRKLLNPAFNQHVLDSFMDIFNNQSRCFVNNLKIEVGKRPFDHWEYSKQIAFETVCMTAVGVDFKERNEAYIEFTTALDKILNIFIIRIQTFWFFSNFIFSLSSLKRKQDACIKILHRTSDTILKQRKEKFMGNLSNGKIIEDTQKNLKLRLNDKKIDRTKIRTMASGKTTFRLFAQMFRNRCKIKAVPGLTFRTFLCAFLCANAFTDREIREHVDTIIAAGFDTISISIMTSMLLIGSYPRVQKKIHEELKNIFGDEDRDVTKLDLPQLEYLEAVIKESMRLYPPVPVIGRHLDKDVKLRNCTLYKGNSVFLFIMGINRHSMWGQDVEEFRPERWLEPSTLPDCPISMPAFSFGRRNCIAKTYAMMSMKITLVHICRNYLIRSDHTKLKLKLDILLRPVSGHYITIEKRK